MSGLSTVQLLVFFSLPIVSSLEGSHYEQPVLEEWGVILHLLKGIGSKNLWLYFKPAATTSSW